MIRLKCPVCGRELAFNFKSDKEPVGGLYEVLVQHMEHYFKVFIDRQGVVRRVFPVDHVVVVDPPRYTVYIYDDRAEIIEGGHSYITDPTPLLEVIKRLIS
ncbi:MAG: hypothetical protein ABWK05_09440 [Pyrobaculum sp.]